MPQRSHRQKRGNAARSGGLGRREQCRKEEPQAERGNATKRIAEAGRFGRITDRGRNLGRTSRTCGQVGWGNCLVECAQDGRRMPKPHSSVCKIQRKQNLWPGQDAGGELNNNSDFLLHGY